MRAGEESSMGALEEFCRMSPPGEVPVPSVSVYPVLPIRFAGFHDKSSPDTTFL